MSELKTDLKASKEQLSIYRQIRKGTLVYAEHLHINTARDGVGGWHSSYKPALLKYRDWNYCEEGFALEFDVIASQDSEPYNPPYQLEYSGRQAQIRGPKYYIADKIKIIPLLNLPLFLDYPYKTSLFEKLFKENKCLK
jgi:hypothetical protein